ncbi:MAG: RNA-binding protein [Deltaproteobacteria bacterium]|nr:RNA-binding protein [Deltaproteobacteria bacterium]
MNIYIGNLSYNVGEDELKEAFEAFGPVESVKIIKDMDSGRSKGFGFIAMTNESEAYTAIDGLNNTELAGRTLKVNKAQPRSDHQRRGKQRGGSRQGRGRRF